MRAALPLGVLAASALAWAAAAELPWPARALLVLLVAPLPAALILQARGLERVSEPLPRTSVYLSSALALWLLALLTFAAAARSGFGGAWLGLIAPPARELIAWSIGLTLLGALVQLASARSRTPETRILLELLPRTATERAAFVALSITAGFAEELVFRGFMIPALRLATGSAVAAVLLSCIAFGVMHAYQGRHGAGRAAALGLALAAPLLATGSVVPGMIAHAAIDVVGGLWLGPRLLRR